MTAAFDVIIPARYGATRLPGKLLRDIAGKPMIHRTYERALESKAERIIVATDDDGIARVVDSFGGTVCRTQSEHATGTDRIAETVEILGFDKDRIIVNLQGDEPCVPGGLIDQVAECLAGATEAEMATVSLPLVRHEDMNDPSVVKVVVDRCGYALYFSRASIPFLRNDIPPGNATHPRYMRRHIGLYAYRVGYLRRFVSLDPSPLEEVEKLEQLRALWHGDRIAVAAAESLLGPSVDTLADLEEVIQIFERRDT